MFSHISFIYRIVFIEIFDQDNLGEICSPAKYERPPNWGELKYPPY